MYLLTAYLIPLNRNLHHKSETSYTETPNWFVIVVLAYIAIIIIWANKKSKS